MNKTMTKSISGATHHLFMNPAQTWVSSSEVLPPQCIFMKICAKETAPEHLHVVQYLKLVAYSGSHAEVRCVIPFLRFLASVYPFNRIGGLI